MICPRDSQVRYKSRTLSIYLSANCQPMVVGTNSNQQESQIWGTVKKTLFSAKQFTCDTVHAVEQLMAMMAAETLQ